MVSLAAYLTDPIKLELSVAKESVSLLGAISAFAWPLITLAILWLYRNPLGEFLKTIGARATEIGIGSWATIKLPEVKEVSSGPVNVIQELKSDQWQESSTQWFDEFANTSSSSEYALLDLGDGKEWISSRLYIFAVLLQRMKSLKCIVFIRSISALQHRFIGCASPENVRWALAVDQPWLEAAFAHAYAQQFSAAPSIATIKRGSSPTKIDGSIEPMMAANIVRSFIYNLKNPAKEVGAESSPDWVTLKSGPEHATWMTESELLRIVGVHLSRDAVEARTDDSAEQRKAEVKRVVAKNAPYVALLKDGSYKALVNRIALLTEIGQSVP
jgi:hypothetical protein